MQFSDVIELGNSSRTEDVRSSASFQSLMISAPVLTRMTNAGFKYPSPVQEKAIPAALSGLDILVQAKSGTGKTLVFSVMAVENLNTRLTYPQRLILAPTREIAGQIRDTVKRIAPIGTKTTVMVGGTPLALDKQSIQKGSHVVIGTTGRICQLIQMGILTLNNVELFVLDEADKLMDESFQKDINFIFSCLPPSRQVAVFSATYPRGLDETLGKYMRDATLIRLNSDDVQLVGIKQYVSVVFGTAVESAVKLFSQTAFNQALVFCNSHAECEPICSRFVEDGFEVAFISSQMAQNERDRVIENLKHNKIKILVSTDLTARGIDASNVNLVVNIGAASNAETYFHRIGRAARFGGQGASVTFLEDGKSVFAFSQIVESGGITAKLFNVSSAPGDLSTNTVFYEKCLPFESKKKTSSAKVVAKVKKASKIPTAPNIKVFDNAVAAENCDNLSYDRKEMLALGQYLPPISDEFMARIRDLDVGRPDFAAEAKKLANQMKSLSLKKSTVENFDEPLKAHAEVKFKSVPIRAKARKKFYLRGEMISVRESISTEDWLRYAESKFNLDEDPFVRPSSKPVPERDADEEPFPSSSVVAAPVTDRKTVSAPSTETVENDFVDDSEATPQYKIRKPEYAYTKQEITNLMRKVSKKDWLLYVKSKWDTSEDPWQLDPELRCPVADQLRKIRERERQQRHKVVADRKAAAELEPKLNASSRFFRRLKVGATSYSDWSSKIQSEFDDFRKNPPTKKGSVVPVRDNRQIWRERVQFYSGWVENLEKRFATAAKISAGGLKEQGCVTEAEKFPVPVKLENLLSEEAEATSGRVKPEIRSKTPDSTDPPVTLEPRIPTPSNGPTTAESALFCPVSPAFLPPSAVQLSHQNSTFNAVYGRYFNLLSAYCQK